jgi:hypothetical protein
MPMARIKREGHVVPEGTKMVQVQVPTGVAPQQVEGFPQDCVRSVRGSLHVRPGTLELTEGELAHLRKHHKDIARRLTVVTPKPVPPPVKAAPAKPAPAPAPAPEAATEAAEESEGKSEDTPTPPRGSAAQRGGKPHKG